jgi:hypothetical protein
VAISVLVSLFAFTHLLFRMESIGSVLAGTLGACISVLYEWSTMSTRSLEPRELLTSFAGRNACRSCCSCFNSSREDYYEHLSQDEERLLASDDEGFEGGRSFANDQSGKASFRHRL